MTPESFEWGVILHLERQPGKLRQKQKNPLSHQLPLKVYKWSVNRNEFLLGFRHHLLRWERDKKKEMEKTGKLCLFEGKMLPISNMMKMHQRCQADVDMLLFLIRPFTEEWVRRTFGVFFRIWMEMHWCTARLDALPEKLWLYLMMKRKRKCVLNRGLEPRFPGCLPDVLCYEWAHLISLSQFHSGK